MQFFTSTRARCYDCDQTIGKDRHGWYGPNLAAEDAQAHATLFGHHTSVETHHFTNLATRMAFERDFVEGAH